MLVRRALAVVAAASMGIAIGAASIAVLPANAAASPITITRVYVDTPGNDLPASNSKVNAEYTIIKNTGKKAVSLTRWTLRDKSNHVYTFGSFTLGAGKSVTVRNGKGTNSSATRYWGSTYYIWNNSGGDAAILKSSGGTTIDTCSWTTVSSYKNC